MYTFSSKLKLISIALIIIGALGMAYGFLTVPKDTHAVEEILKAQHDSHDAHATADSHDTHAKAETHDSHAKKDSHAASSNHDKHEAHVTHVMHQLQNKPWTAFFTAAFFFFMLALLALVFYSIQWAGSAGWSIVLFRVMEAITAYLLPGSILLLLFLFLSTSHFNHLFTWMDPENVAKDSVLQLKAPWLNPTGFMIRSIIFIAGWNIFRYFLRKNSIALDNSGDLSIYKRNFNVAVGFLGFFIVTELFFVFDMTMSLDPHWFSQLYPFYVFASMMVTAVTVILMLTLYLKGKGYLPKVNQSHIHDLGKFMFGFSIFWAYFFFDQFMLQWYSHQPEETVYWVPRLLGAYQPLFIAMLFMSFVIPFLMLIGSDLKKISKWIMVAGFFIIIGHFIDIYMLIAPATVGDQWSFGISEFGTILFFTGIFMYAVFNSLSKAPLHAKGNPFMKESEHYHYYNL